MIFHYCCNHSVADILSMEEPAVVPPGMLKPELFGRTATRRLLGSLSWFTDLEVVHGNALGLRRVTGVCDRTENRLRVCEEDEDLLTPWWRFRRAHPDWRNLAGLLEAEPGVMPAHWYVATVPVRVVAL